MYREDCPRCEGTGWYTVTSCPYEEPIRCNCDDYTDEEWKEVKECLIQLYS